MQGAAARVDSDLQHEDEASMFVDELIAAARRHRAVCHPFLRELVAGTIPRTAECLAEFLYQYQVYSAQFVAYLDGARTQLANEEHVARLGENINEERGSIDDHELEQLRAVGIDPEWVIGVPHPRLFGNFLAAIDCRVGSRPYDVSSTTWRDLFLLVCRHGGAAQAVGALGPATESIVRTIYFQILEAIDAHLDIGRRDRVFFDLHAHFDDAHGEILRKIAIELATTPEGREGLARGVAMALQLREGFFDAQHRRALAGAGQGARA